MPSLSGSPAAERRKAPARRLSQVDEERQMSYDELEVPYKAVINHEDNTRSGPRIRRCRRAGRRRVSREHAKLVWIGRARCLSQVDEERQMSYDELELPYKESRDTDRVYRGNI
jgi:hypothetical protein